MQSNDEDWSYHCGPRFEMWDFALRTFHYRSAEGPRTSEFTFYG